MRPSIVASHALGLLGAALGGSLGVFTFRWVIGQGFYALVIPGAFLGAGCGVLARHESRARGIACGLAGIALGFYSEWMEFPFVADPSLGFFLGHIPELKPITLIMIGAGGLVAFWIGKDTALGRRAASVA